MGETRNRIIQTLQNNPRSTVTELADAVGINAISVRHHIASLMAEGLLVSDEVRHGVGRPKQVFSLSDEGQERYSTRYLRLTNLLLNQLKDTVPQPVLQSLMQKIADDMAAGIPVSVSELTLEGRLDALQSILEKEGFVIEWEKQGDTYVIREKSCPFYHVGQNHPEICTVDRTLIARLLRQPIEKVSCLLSGDNQCTYVIGPEVIQEDQ